MEKFTLTELKVIIDACIGGDSGLGPDSIDTTFDELDIDSLAVYETMTRLEESVHIVVTDDEIDALRTARQILAFVNARLAEVAA